MAMEFQDSVAKYKTARNLSGDDINRDFNVDSSRQSVVATYLECIRICHTYALSQNDSVILSDIFGRKNMGIKLERSKKTMGYGLVTIGVVKGGDIPTGIEHDVRFTYELKKFLTKSMGFMSENLNDAALDGAIEQLAKIEADKKIKIEEAEIKKWRRTK